MRTSSSTSSALTPLRPCTATSMELASGTAGGMESGAITGPTRPSSAERVRLNESSTAPRLHRGSRTLTSVIEDSIWIVVLSYNGLQDTQKCLTSLAAAQRPGVTTLLVDNGSADRTAAIV